MLDKQATPLRATHRGATLIGFNALALSIFLAFGAAPTPVQAQDASVSIRIAAQPLEAALETLGEQAGLHIFYLPELVKGVNAPGVSGQLTADEALRTLLAGTGIQFRRTGSNVSLSRGAASEATQLAPVTVLGQASSITEGSGTYASHVVSVGKGAQNLREIPQSITVMSRQRIEDQGLQSLADVFKNTTGVTTSQRDNEPIGRIYARGFEIQNLQVDGSSFGPYSPQYMNPNLSMYDHVEVLRGADGLFSGNGTPGGTINLVRKRPLAEPQVQLTTSAGKWDRYRAELDVTGPLLADGKVRGRTVITRENRKGFLDDDWGRSTFVYGIVEADLGPMTTLSLGGSYEKEDMFGRPAGLPRGLDGSDLHLPRSWTADNAAWGTKHSETKDAFAQLSHTFANDWEAKLSAGYGKRNRDRIGAGHLMSTGVDPITRAIAIAANGAAWNVHPMTGYASEYKNADVNLQGAFSALSQTHSFLVGADWARFDTFEYTRRYRAGVANGGAWTGSIDELGSAPFIYPYPTMDTTRPMTEWPTIVTQYGLYGRLNWSLTEQAKVIAGARYGYYKSDATTLNYNENATLANRSVTIYEDKGVFTPYLGATYDIDKRWTAYGSVSEIYQSQANRRSGPPDEAKALDPITGRNMEIGLKGELNNGKLLPAIALYRIKRSGVAVLNPNYPSQSLDDGHNCCYLPSGEQVSQGVDLELTGEVLPGWTFAAGYTFNQNRDKATDAVYHAATPKHMLRLWTNLRLPAAASAWSVGMGVNVQSRSYVSGSVFAYNPASGLFNGPSSRFNFTQGGYAVWNAAVHYDINPTWRATLNLNNLFDKRYYANVGTLTGQNMYGDPFNWMVSLRGRF